MMAIMHQQPETVKILIQEGADLSIKNTLGETALTLASQKGSEEIKSSILAARHIPFFHSPSDTTRPQISKTYSMPTFLF